MAQIRKSVAALDRLEKSSGLSHDGRNWLITAADPFHDTDIRPTGFPDVNCSGSVVQLVKQQITISCPNSVTAGTWDVNIRNAPWWISSPISRLNTVRNKFDLTNGVSALTACGGIVADAGPTGNPLNIGAGAATTTLPLNNTYFDGPARVVACGFEVTNTTAEIYRQGSVTVYRQPQPGASAYTGYFVTNIGTGTEAAKEAITCYKRKDSPYYVADAQILSGSRTWNAAEGSYSILTMTDVGLLENDQTPCCYDLRSADGNTSQLAGLTGIGTYPVPILFNESPYSMVGAFYTGLSLQTTLTLTVHYYIERFPTSLNADLVVLAAPSPKYDPVALELYSHMLGAMPPGVMVKENGLGQWFTDLIAEVAPMAADALSAIPHPFAQVAAQGARAAGRVAQGVQAKSMDRKAIKASVKAKQKAKKKGKARKP